MKVLIAFLTLGLLFSCKKEEPEPEPLPAPPPCVTPTINFAGKYLAATGDTLKVVWNNNNCPSNADVNTYYLFNFGRCMNRMKNVTTYDSVVTYVLQMNEKNLRGPVYGGSISGCEAMKSFTYSNNMLIDHNGIYAFNRVP